MNKIYKVMYSKVKQCVVVVSEIAKSHSHNGESSGVRKHAALTAAVLIALGGVSFITNPEVAYADLPISNDYYLGISKADDSRTKDDNANGKGARGTDSITIGHNSTASNRTITIGDRRADDSEYSVYLGEHYTAANQAHPDPGSHVTSIGYDSDARGTGSIALGSGAEADVNRASEGGEKNPDADSASVAIGYQAKANKNNIAIGAKSVASDKASTTAAVFTNQAAPNSYVSVGDGIKDSDTQYRRISNVADGAADSDAATIAQLKEAVKETDASKKANIDASNIGKNLKSKADGKTAADSKDITTNENAWGAAIGTGSIANSNTNGSGQLVTGTTVYNYVAPKAVAGKALQYISEDKSTGINLGILDDKVSTNATDITGLKSLSNITDNGKTVIKKAAVGAVKVTAGDRITVTPDSKNLTDADTVTYTISAKNDGKVAKGNSDLVSGDTVYQALQNQTKSLTYTGGWGINIDSSKKISLKNNLTTVIYDKWDNSSKNVKFNIDDTAMAIGGAIFNNIGWQSYVDGKTMTIDSTGHYSVRLGGINNSTTGIYSTVTGGSANVASGYASSVNGGKNNTASGKYATVIGGGYLWTEAYENGDFPDVDESIFGSHASSDRNDASGILSTIIGGYGNKASGKNSLIVGGLYNEASNESASIFGGGSNRAAGDRTTISGGMANFAVGDYSNVSGGIASTTEGRFSTISGGYGNIIADEGPVQPNRQYYGFTASGRYGSAFGGGYNVVGGENGTAVGGGHSVVYGVRSVGLAGGSTGLGAHYALAAGYQSVVTSKGSKLLVSDKRNEFTDDYYYDNQGYAYKILGKEQNSKHIDFIPEYEDVATAVGYQATANEPDTISFGHDVGDVSGYDVKWKERTDKDKWGNINTNPDGTINDYAKKPDIIINHYDTAKYNRLVKVADGINNHDVVVMEQLRNADNVGKNAKNNVVVYKENNDGTLQVDENGEAIIDVDASKAATEKATEQAIKDSEDAWGKALGADPFTAGTATTATNASTSDQLVTGKTLYDYDKPTGSTNYVNANNTTGQNLSALDAQVKANADALDQPNHNIKYYSVKDKTPDDKLLPSIPGYLNDKNDGAKGMGSIAAGFNTHADGIASTVAGSYSGVMNTGTAWGPLGLDYRGATAVSLGTVNVNNNTDTSKPYSGVANSIVGQANMTTNSNAAIIYGAGNTVTDSYRQIAEDKALAILGNRSDPTKLGKAMQDAVKESGGQVMVMGGGNTVDKAYMTQVTGVGDTVTGADSTYAEGTSTQYNFVDGFQNELTNGKHDYIIGSNNTVSGDSIDQNQSNIVFGDNHKLTNQKNNVIIGSSDTADDETTASDVVAIGHNAKVSAEGGVAIGSGSEVAAASTEKVSGYDPTTKTQSADKTSHAWNATTGAVSIGTSDGTVTRQINGVAAGTNDTDAVNVAQLKKLGDNTVQYDLNTQKGKITLAGQDGTTITNVKSALDGAKDANGNIATIATATGDALKNAANLGDLQNVYNDISAKADKASTSHTALTVEGNTPAGKGKDEKTKEDVYAGKNILLHESTDENGKVTYDLKLAQNLTGITSISNQTTGAKITLGTDGATTISGGDVSVSNNKITNIKAGEVKENSKDAVNGDQLYNEQKARTDADTAINNKIGTFDNSKTYNYIDKTASISTNLTTLDTHVKKNAEDISQINTRIDTLDGNAVKYDDSAKSKITLAGSDGTTIDHVKDGTISSTSKEAVNGGQLYNEQQARTAADTDINNKIGTFDNSKTYNYIDKTASISTNLTTLDTHVKKNAEDISQINTRIDTLDGNAVKYDDSAKSKITLAGSDGTTIDHVKDGTISSTSKEAVNGGQLFAEKTARENVDTEIKTDITKIKDGEGFTNKGQTVIKSLAQDAVDVKGSDYVTVTNETKDGTKTFTVSVDGNGKVDSGDKGLISGDTIYNELRPSADGSYIEKDSTTAQNLVSLDTQVKKTSDLINSDGKTIKIGGSDAATKIDVNGKDGKGRVITGVVSDANDPTSAANVGYVNGLTAANTQQIYRDMNNAYGRLNNNINKAAAGSNALAALHPLDYDPDDKADFAVGYGHYRNANAAAVGAFYHPNENTMVNVGVSLGNGDPGFNAGVSFKVGRGGAGREAMSKTEMAKVINSQSKEIDALKKDNADKDKRIDALEQKMAEILAKLDKNGK